MNLSTLVVIPPVRPFGVSIRAGNLFLFPIGPATIDLSEATKLRDVVFRPESLNVKWIATAFQTATAKHQELQKISINLPYRVTFLDLDTIKLSAIYREWLDLDHHLVQFVETRSVGPKVISTAWVGRNWNARGHIECLLPEMMKGGAIDLVVLSIRS